ncbi:hypothetical protein HanHA300_Chr08g0273641 [Helianthus annuus]|nr:hypothetical protein HanHA300_Chr08g0273641 [Helianthus annuus]KAJ0718630.1 hypothetical protein HanLR1_Chr08g0272741 [Helianthus annuus]
MNVLFYVYYVCMYVLNRTTPLDRTSLLGLTLACGPLEVAEWARPTPLMRKQTKHSLGTCFLISCKTHTQVTKP